MKNADAATKTRILSFASHTIQSQGTKALSISQIAKECKISKSTFYAYFASKEELLLQLKSESDIDHGELQSIKERIISTAIEELSKHSFQDIEMEDIAKSAGINRSSIYRYYSNKEDLLVASIQNELENRERVLEKLKEGEDDPIAFIEQYMEYFFEYANNPYTSLLYATMIYYSKKNERIKESFSRLREYTVRLLTDHFEEGKRKGIFKDGFDSFVYSQMFFSVMSGINIHSPESFLDISQKFLELLYKEIRVG